jgi:protein required for attachment to host cells
METYKNSYDKNEDVMLWELHEIRHELHKELSRKTVEEINRDALKKFQEWQRQNTEKSIAK